ncbi:hypothetical protein BDV38DRAFT_258192, partial [Aspergillus pseudotamarii]
MFIFIVFLFILFFFRLHKTLEMDILKLWIPQLTYSCNFSARIFNLIVKGTRNRHLYRKYIICMQRIGIIPIVCTCCVLCRSSGIPQCILGRWTHADIRGVQSVGILLALIGAGVRD